MKITVQDVRSLLDESQNWCDLRGVDFKEACEMFPGRYDTVSRMEDALVKIVAELKNALNVKTADIELKMRSEPDKYGLPAKPTEGAIKSALMLHSEIQSITKKILGWESLLRSVKSRAISLTYVKSMLRNLAMTASLNLDSSEV